MRRSIGGRARKGPVSAAKFNLVDRGLSGWNGSWSTQLGDMRIAELAVFLA